MEHIMKLYEENFEELKSGKKKREYRLNDQKRKAIKVGDTIKFLRLPNLDEEIIVTVTNIERFTNWHDCYSKYFDEDFKDKYKNVNEVVEDTFDGGYYTKEESEKNGCIIFSISKISIIRHIEKKDYDSIKRLFYQVHNLHLLNRPDIYVNNDPLPLDYFNEILNNENALNYVYEENNNIYGLLMAMKVKNRQIPISKSRSSYFIDTIVVDEEYRGKGIGKTLYNFLKEHAIKNNIDAIDLNVWAFNEKAIKFYESLGMTVKNMKLEQILNTNNIETKKLTCTITNKVNY